MTAADLHVRAAAPDPERAAVTCHTLGTSTWVTLEDPHTGDVARIFGSHDQLRAFAGRIALAVGADRKAQDTNATTALGEIPTRVHLDPSGEEVTA